LTRPALPEHHDEHYVNSLTRRAILAQFGSLSSRLPLQTNSVKLPTQPASPVHYVKQWNRPVLSAKNINQLIGSTSSSNTLWQFIDRPVLSAKNINQLIGSTSSSNTLWQFIDRPALPEHN
jgi:hypothetical protein